MSSTGIPSVIATISRSPASADSRIASAAPPPGTNTMATSAAVAATASATVGKMGTPSCSARVPGLAPATTRVP